MQETTRTSESVHAERAVLVGLILPGIEPAGTRYDPLAELASLSAAAGAEVVGRLIQKRDRPAAGTYLGRGKVDELAEYAAAKDGEVVVFDNELSPSQIRELERIVKRKVIDRTELILDIFASRARTHAARLQVELAQLEYTAPRLRGMWTHLERIAGAGGGTAVGAVGGIGTRGPGERQIEIDRRIVQKRVTQLRDQLAGIDRRKLREVRARRNHFTIGLVGYTNAGKSTLMNALTDAGALVEGKPFATLDTKTRRWDFGGGRMALLSDTVGFVRNLPHHLVASFRATLEEALHADLLLHVVDASAEDATRQFRAVNAVLDELGCGDASTLTVLNKMDAVTEPADVQVLHNQLPDAIGISARRRHGLDELTAAVLECMQESQVRVTIDADSGNGKLLAYVRRHGRVIEQTYLDGSVRLDLELPPGEIRRVIALGGVRHDTPPEQGAARTG